MTPKGRGLELGFERIQEALPSLLTHVQGFQRCAEIRLTSFRCGRNRRERRDKPRDARWKRADLRRLGTLYSCECNSSSREAAWAGRTCRSTSCASKWPSLTHWLSRTRSSSLRGRSRARVAAFVAACRFALLPVTDLSTLAARVCRPPFCLADPSAWQPLLLCVWLISVE